MTEDRAGLVGSLTRNHCRDIGELEAQLVAVGEELKRFREAAPDRRIGPLAVNISPLLDPADMRAHMALCARHGA